MGPNYTVSNDVTVFGEKCTQTSLSIVNVPLQRHASNNPARCYAGADDTKTSTVANSEFLK